MTKSNKLPEWFQLDNYQDAKSLSPIEWYENLNKRRMFFVYHRISQSNAPNLSTWRKEDSLKRIKNIVDSIAAKPLIRVVGESEKIKYFSQITVEFLKNEDIVNNYEALEEKAPPIFAEYTQLRTQSQDAAFTFSYNNDELRTFFMKPFEFYEKALVSVNLSATDEHIIKDFKHWLTTFRETSSSKSFAKKIFSSTDFQEWADYKILPYLDLKMWTLFSKCKITQAILGKVLFPEEFDLDTTERIRRTTKPKAEWLMNNSVLNALGVQIRKNSKSNKAT